MLSLLIFAGGYIFGNGEMGARLINGLDWLLIVTYVLGGLLGVIFVGLLVAVLAGNKLSSLKLKGYMSNLEQYGMGLAITVLGLFVASLIALSIALNKWTQSNIDPLATSLSSLSGNAQIGLGIIFTMIIVGAFTKNKKD